MSLFAPWRINREQRIRSDEESKSDIETAPKLVSFEIQPPRGTVKCQGEQQLKAIARYSDGTVRDVTNLALYESNDRAMAEANERGLVKISDISGNVAVMVRYQGQTCRSSALRSCWVRLSKIFQHQGISSTSMFLRNLKEIGIPPSPPCGDSQFLRRVTLDIAGRLPTEDENHRVSG